MPELILASSDPVFLHALREALEPDWRIHTGPPAESLSGAAVLVADVRHDNKLINNDYPMLLVGTSEESKASECWLAPPFSLAELRNRLQLLLSRGYTVAQSGRMVTPGVVFWAAERRIGGSVSVMLTEKETLLLSCLLDAEGQSVRREEVLQRVWGYSAEADTHTLETHIYRLRAKLKELGLEAMIETTPDGYALAGLTSE